MRKPAQMKTIAIDMGYKSVADIPSEKLGEYSDNMIIKFGDQRSREMLLRQIMYRKGIPPKAKNKFMIIYENIRVKNKEGISDIVKSSGTNFIKGLSQGMGLGKGENK